MAERPEFVLIDGHAVAYRQFFALKSPGFVTRSGEITNAVYGFTRILMDIIQNEKPKYLAVSFDMGLSGRESVYEDYKANRDEMPDELRTQIERTQQVVKAFNIPLLKLEGYEADDVIGTIVKKLENHGVDIRIITGDRDILQLLAPHVRVQLPQRGDDDKVYDEAAFREKYGLEPNQLIDMKALWGDSSDNIPGVKGIGEKGATKLLLEYHTLDGIYEHIDEIKGSTQKKLIESKEMAYLSQELATIQQDVPIEFDINACVAHDYDPAEVDKLFDELEFRGFRDRLRDLHSDVDLDAGEESDVRTVIVRDKAALAKLVAALNKAQAITWDVETTGKDPVICDLVGIALSTDGKTGYYIPVGHVEQREGEQMAMFPNAVGDQLSMDTVIEALRPSLTNPEIPKYAHNATYDLVVMQRYGIDVSPVGFDTMIAEWVNDPISRFLGLKALVRDRLGITMTDIDALIGKGRNQITMDVVAIEDAAPYAAADAALTHRLVKPLKEKLVENESLELFNALEMPLIPVIASMEQAGVQLDLDFLKEMSDRLAEQIIALEQQIYDLSGGYGAFNINSPKQLNDVLFEKLGLPVEGLKKTTHGYSTDAVTLDALLGKHEIIKQIIDYRELTKLKSTYVDSLPQLVNPRTGRVHTSYNQTGTSTGRFSSSDPNLQNIPIRTELGREVRRAFVAPEGMKLLAVDYSQVELRVMAHISGDEGLLDAFRQGQDIHRATAAAVTGVAPEEVTYEQRSFAKRVNFGLMYGMGAFRLARDSDLTLAQADDFIKVYFERFPGVLNYIEDTKRQAREKGYVQTLLGRRRYFPVLQSGKTGQRAMAEERAAINMPIQGTAADILKQAMLNLYAELSRRYDAVRLILQVHDELVLEVPENDVDEVTKLVVDVMEAAFELDAPLKANAECGTNWRDMEEIH